MPVYLRLIVVALLVALTAAGCSRRPPPDTGPPTYIGAWKGVNRGNTYIVHLHEDGTFRAEPQAGAVGGRLTGRWGVKDRSMWWIYNEKASPERSRQGGYDDVNPIVPRDRNHFELVEADGSHTTYDRILR